MRMVCALCALMCLRAGLGAQSAAVTSASDDMSVARARINQQRDLLESDFVKAQQACDARFAVFDCLQQARRERRSALDKLRRQEMVLNRQDRQAKAQAELDRISRNASTERQEELVRHREQAALPSIQGWQSRSEQKKLPSVESSVVVAPMPAER